MIVYLQALIPWKLIPYTHTTFRTHSLTIYVSYHNALDSGQEVNNDRNTKNIRSHTTWPRVSQLFPNPKPSIFTVSLTEGWIYHRYVLICPWESLLLPLSWLRRATHPANQCSVPLGTLFNFSFQKFKLKFSNWFQIWLTKSCLTDFSCLFPDFPQVQILKTKVHSTPSSCGIPSIPLPLSLSKEKKFQK